MIINLTTLLLAAGAGMLGTLTGGMEAFIIYGFVTIIQTVLASTGHDMTFYNQYLSNLVFLPAVMFSASVPATGYAARKYDIHEWEIDRSLAFTHDPGVLIVGAITGMIGYSLFAFAVNMNFPMDTGAFSVVTVAVIARFIFHKDRIINKDASRVLRDGKKWVWELMVAAGCSALTAYFVQATGIVTAGFMFSAALLILQLFQRTQFFPTTHQITMVAGLAMAATGNIFIAILFGMLSQIIFTLFGGYLNMGCGTHIDPPAVAIGICSLLISLIF
ncbi:MAG: hypothetical protein IKR11_08435 [Solobacterium sp.]|nr:hypothetical protein [Solobacterium sp.]